MRVGEVVGLFQVLRGQEDGDAGRYQLPDDLPDDAATARVEPGRWLVQEDQSGTGDQGHGQVEPPAHAHRVGHRRLGRRLHEIKTVEQYGDPPATLVAIEMTQVGHQAQVLRPRELPVDGRHLPGHADERANRIRLGGQVVAKNAYLATVRTEKGGENVDDGRLAGTVRARAGQTRYPPRPRIRRHPGQPACRTTCAGRAPGWQSLAGRSCGTSTQRGGAGQRFRCRAPRQRAAGPIGPRSQKARAEPSARVPRASVPPRWSTPSASCRI